VTETENQEISPRTRLHVRRLGSVVPGLLSMHRRMTLPQATHSWQVMGYGGPPSPLWLLSAGVKSAPSQDLRDLDPRNGTATELNLIKTIPASQ